MEQRCTDHTVQYIHTTVAASLHAGPSSGAFCDRYNLQSILVTLHNGLLHYVRSTPYSQYSQAFEGGLARSPVLPGAHCQGFRVETLQLSLNCFLSTNIARVMPRSESHLTPYQYGSREMKIISAWSSFASRVREVWVWM